MSEIKLIIDGTEYEFEPWFGALAGKTPTLYFDGLKYIGKAIPKQPSNDWEIVSFRGANKTYTHDDIWKLNGRQYSLDRHKNSFELHAMLYGKNSVEDGKLEIYEVRRISDGEVFKVGDDTKWGKINKFNLSQWSNQITAYFEFGDVCTEIYLSDLEKVKPKLPLFKDELGNNLFEGEIVFTAHLEAGLNTAFISRHGTKENANDCGYKWFKCKDDAENWLLENKPISISYKEIKDARNRCANLKEFFKNKINP